MDFAQQSFLAFTERIWLVGLAEEKASWGGVAERWE